MSDFQSDFQAALPQVIKWDVKDNRFEDKEKYPKALSLFIPQESIAAFAQHLTAMAADSEKLRAAKIWDYDNNQEVEVQGVYLNAKGKTGEYGDFGNINPALLAANPPTDACGLKPPAADACGIKAPADESIPF